MFNFCVSQNPLGEQSSCQYGGGSLLLELGLNLVWEELRRESMQAGKGGQREPQSGWPQVGMVRERNWTQES